MYQIGRKIIRLESVDSTNNYTAIVVKEGKAEHGTVILAVEQYAGRGQRNAEWLANAGENLTFSIFWNEVNLSVEKQFCITRFISLALLELLRKFEIDAKIKWPNDIYVGDKKIAGVLIENQLQGSNIRSSIIGIGLNVNQNNFDGLNGTSMALEKGKKFVLDDVLFSFCGVLNELSEGGTSMPLSTEANYHKNIYLLDCQAEFMQEDGSILSGMIKGVCENGKLRIESNGIENEYDLKEIKFIPQTV